MKKLFLFVSLALLVSSCYRLMVSSGGGQNVEADEQRRLNPEDVSLPDDYQIEVVAQDLTFPTGVAFDEEGTLYVTESGYSYGEVFKEPKLLRIHRNGSTETVISGSKNGPWNGVFYNEGFFYIAEGGQLEGGKILKVTPDGKMTALIENLPSLGDHHTNGPVVQDGFVYFGQGTATNSSVVGEDNYQFGWLKRNPDFHDIPCKDITLTGANYTTENVLDDESNEKVTTGSFLSYGTTSEKGQVIPGEIPCSGAVMRVPVNGGEPELVAWGFRNPFGLAFDPEGQLYITDNGYDMRGSRPVWGTGDYLWKAQQETWYGWPDFAGGLEINKIIELPGGGKPKKILMEYPGKPPHPAASLGVHSSSNGFDFSKSADFGFVGEAFIAQFGDMAPGVGKVLSPVGFRVVRVNPETGEIFAFVSNKKGNAPASKLKTGGVERPVAVRFSPEGNELYIVDFGVMLTSEKGAQPIAGTGVIWKVSKK